MKSAELKEMRRKITALIDDIKYHSDSLTDLDRLPVLQLKVILAKMNKLTEKTTILLHYVEIGKKASTADAAAQMKEIPAEVPAAPSKTEDSSVKSGKKQDIQEKLKKLKVNDLMTAIGINEKYLFASALFKGNMEEFTMAMGEINSLDDPKKLQSHIDKLSKKYGWNAEAEITKEFIELLERKFDQL